MVNSSMSPTRSLIIGRKRSRFEDESAIDDMCAALMWNLNPGRAIVLLPEDWSRDDMFPLAEMC